jgi:hypothetical protein
VLVPIPVAAWSKTWNVFTHSNNGIVGSNPTRGMVVCVRLSCVCAVLCVGSGLATGWSPIQRNWKSGRRLTKDCRNTDAMNVLAAYKYMSKAPAVKGHGFSTNLEEKIFKNLFLFGCNWDNFFAVGNHSVLRSPSQEAEESAHSKISRLQLIKVPNLEKTITKSQTVVVF